MVQWVGLHASPDEGLGYIPGQQTKIPTSHVAWPKKKKNHRLFFKLKLRQGRLPKDQAVSSGD